MKVLVFDTETTGLPTERNASITECNKWPYIVQLSYILYDVEEKKMISCRDDIIQLDPTINISEKSIEIHGITHKKCQRKGIAIKEAINIFNDHLKQADCVVGHNISFDKRMIMVECIRNQLRQQFTVNGVRMSECCTMRHFTEVCNLHRVSKNGHSYLKFPTLSETYNHLFRTQPKNTHDAMADVIICLRCYVYGLHSGQDISKEACRSLKELFTLYCL
jgi:DNA polymerase-3 subunit epsilon